MKSSTVLKSGGIALCLISVVIGGVFFFGIRALSAHSFYYLDRFYSLEKNPNPKYSDLYDYALNITQASNAHFLYLGLLAIASWAALGMVVILWSKDRKRNENHGA